MNSMTRARSDFSWQALTTLPNVLTYARMATIPLIVALLVSHPSATRLNTAFVLFCLASITDCLDGILARRRNLVTSMGKLLDPLADKLLTSAVMIMLIPLGKIQAWLVFLIIGREMTITGLRSIAAGHGLIINASRMGKNKMISQTVGLHFLLLTVPSVQTILDGIGTFFLWASLILGLWSASDYMTQFYREARRQESYRE